MNSRQIFNQPGAAREHTFKDGSRCPTCNHRSISTERKGDTEVRMCKFFHKWQRPVDRG